MRSLGKQETERNVENTAFTACCMEYDGKAYFDCTVALDGSFVALVPVEPPSFFSPA
jgi:hypothetical protein